MSAPAWTHGEAKVGLGIAAMLFACFVGCGPSDGGGTTAFVSSSSSSSGWGPPSGSGGSSNPPVVALVDPDRTLTAQPGQGVGVFTEYATGGHWHVWWTCDSAVNGTGDSCLFDIDASVSTGSLTLVRQSASSVGQSNQRDLHVSTVTTTGIDELFFDATPGQPIQLEVRLNGVRDGRFFFFVQNGLVNGGYTGPLSDPLVFSPAP